MNRPDDNDELIRRYREAGAQDMRRPSPQIGEAVRAHARMTAASKAAGPAPSPTPAANQSRWKISLLASIALAGLTGLVVLQFDRGTADEQEIALGRQAPAVASPSPASPPPAVADATVARSDTPAARPATPTTRAAPGSGRPAPATASPVPAAESAPSIPPPAAQPAPAPARERRAELMRDEASEKAMPPTATQAMARAAAPAPAPAPAPAAPAPAPAAAARAPALRTPAPAQESLAAQAPRSTAALAAALHQAARAGQVADLEALLQQGAPVNAPDGSGRTALSLGVIHGHSALVRRLLALGANPALVDSDGLDALQHARRLGREDMVRLLEARS
jgi:hypothetical protein